jgi:hypothetical protein
VRHIRVNDYDGALPKVEMHEFKPNAPVRFTVRDGEYFEVTMTSEGIQVRLSGVNSRGQMQILPGSSNCVEIK